MVEIDVERLSLFFMTSFDFQIWQYMGVETNYVLYCTSKEYTQTHTNKEDLRKERKQKDRVLDPFGRPSGGGCFSGQQIKSEAISEPKK